MSRTRGLGRGLDALLPTASKGPRSTPHAPPSARSPQSGVFECALEKLVPNRKQPRKHFDQKALTELASSIERHGLIEPIIARAVAGTDQYEIVAGERRWRACQQAGLREALVVIKDFGDEKAYEVALIENVQRENLNAIEFAAALMLLQEEYGHTQEQLAVVVGKDRSTITNALRLLKLPLKVRELVISGALSEGHGRALLGVTDPAAQHRLAELVVRKQLNVRQTEAEVRALKNGGSGSGAKKKKSPSIKDLELRLSRRLGTRCEVKDREGKGELTIKYANLDELDRVLDILL